MTTAIPEERRSSPWVHTAMVAAAFCLALIVFVLRRPGVVLYPQLWAEDGQVWLQDAFDHGPWASLTIPHTGYFQTISRLTMSIGSMLPIADIPLFANSVALLVRCAAIAFLFSSRFRFVDIRAKLLILVYYVLMPNILEVHANITNTHWYLAMYLLLVLLAEPRAGWLWRLHDVFIMILSGLSGPFIVFLAPGYAIKLLVEVRQRGFSLRNAVAVVLRPFPIIYAAIFALQFGSILLSATGARTSAPLGATPELLAQILTTRIFLGFAMAARWFPAVAASHLLDIIVTCVAVALLVAVFVKGDWRAKSVVLFGALTIAATLYAPQMADSGDQWPLFLINGGQRYFVVTSMMWFCVLLYFYALFVGRFAGIAAVAVAGGLVALSVITFSMPPLIDLGYAKAVAMWPQVPVGYSVEVPIQPGGDWHVTIPKR